MRKFISCSLVILMTAMLISSCRAADPASKSVKEPNETNSSNAETTTIETTKVTEKIHRIEADFKYSKDGTAYPTDIRQYDKDGIIAFSYSASNTSSNPLLYIYEDGVDYTVKLKQYIIDYKFEDLSTVRDQYDYKNDYYIKEEYEYDADHKVVKSTQHFPNGSYEYGDFKKVVTEYTRNDKGYVIGKNVKASGSKSRKNVTDVWTYGRDDNGNLTSSKLNGKYCWSYSAETHKVEYDDHNNIVRIVKSYGKVEYDITYDDAGHDIKIVEKSLDKKDKVTFVATTTKEYNNHGDLIREATKAKGIDQETTHEYKYDENGKMTYHHVRSSDGDTNDTTIYEYDKDGFVIKKEKKDKKGNARWTIYKYWGDDENQP